MPVILGEKTEKLRDQLTARGLKNGPEFEFFVLLNMGIFQPAMLVYQRVLFSETTQIFVPVCQEETDPVALRVLRNS